MGENLAIMLSIARHRLYMAKKQAEIHEGKIKGFTQFVSETYGIERSELWAKLCLQFPSLKDPKNCANCGRRMVINVYQADLHTGLLLYKMAQEVREMMRKGKSFTEANLVHVPSLVHTRGATEATTKGVAIAQYLNYVHQPESKTRSGYYVITKSALT